MSRMARCRARFSAILERSASNNSAGSGVMAKAAKGAKSWPISIIEDADTQGKLPSGNEYCAHLKHGYLEYDAKAGYSVRWTDEVALKSGYNRHGRGLELSDLVVFHGNLLTVCDRTGIVFKISNNKLVPLHILSDADGEMDTGFKGEWMTIKDGTLFIGSFGRVAVDEPPGTAAARFLYVKTINAGRLEHHNWTKHFDRVTAAYAQNVRTTACQSADGTSTVTQTTTTSTETKRDHVDHGASFVSDSTSVTAVETHASSASSDADDDADMGAGSGSGSGSGSGAAAGKESKGEGESKAAAAAAAPRPRRSGRKRARDDGDNAEDGGEDAAAPSSKRAKTESKGKAASAKGGKGGGASATKKGGKSKSGKDTDDAAGLLAALKGFEGYLSHESCRFDAATREWVFLPRKAHTRRWTEQDDEKRGADVMLTASEDFSAVRLQRVGDLNLERGFSAFSFVPGTTHIVALKSNETLSHDLQTFITVFDRATGKTLLPETLVGARKFEGIYVWKNDKEKQATLKVAESQESPAAAAAAAAGSDAAAGAGAAAGAP